MTQYSNCYDFSIAMLKTLAESTEIQKFLWEWHLGVWEWHLVDVGVALSGYGSGT